MDGKKEKADDMVEMAEREMKGDKAKVRPLSSRY